MTVYLGEWLAGSEMTSSRVWDIWSRKSGHSSLSLFEERRTSPSIFQAIFQSWGLWKCHSIVFTMYGISGSQTGNRRASSTEGIAVHLTAGSALGIVETPAVCFCKSFFNLPLHEGADFISGTPLVHDIGPHIDMHRGGMSVALSDVAAVLQGWCLFHCPRSHR